MKDAFDKDVAEKMPKTKRQGAKRPWDIMPQPVDEEAADETIVSQVSQPRLRKSKIEAAESLSLPQGMPQGTYLQGQSEPEIHLRNYIGVLLARKWVILIVFISILSVAIHRIQTTLPVYEAKAVLLHEQQRTTPMVFEKLQLLTPSTVDIEAQRQILKSPLILNEIMKRMRDHPEFYFKTYGELGGVISLTSPRRTEGILEISTQASTPDLAAAICNIAATVYVEKNAQRKNADLDQAISFLSNQLAEFDKLLSQSEQELNRFREKEGLIFQEKGGDKVLGSGLLTQFGQLQKELLDAQTQQQLAKAKLVSVQEVLKGKLKKLDLQTQKKQASLLTGGISAEILQLQRKIIDLQLELDEKRQSLQENNPVLLKLEKQLAAAQNRLNTELANMKGEGAEDLESIIEWQNLVRQETDLTVELKGQEKKVALLEDKMNQFKAKHPELISKEVEFVQLDRKARQYEETCNFLMQRSSETKMLRQMQTSEYTVIASALSPGAPIKPKKMTMLLLGTILGLTLGVGSVFFLEYMDDSLKSKEVVERFLGLSVVGEIPHLRVSKEMIEKVRSVRSSQVNSPTAPTDAGVKNEAKRSRRKRRESIRLEKQRLAMLVRNIDNLPQPDAESYRSLQAAVQFASLDYIGQPVKTLLVTSPTPEEGKTLTAGNLAIAYASIGKKTLLVDCDFRKPQIHIIFEQLREPGLSEYILDLMNTEKLSQTGDLARFSPNRFIRETNIKNLSILPCGKIPPSSIAVLSSNMFSKLIEHWKWIYDVVLIDSPPVLSVADASVLTSKMDEILMVVRAGRTKRQLAIRAKEIIEGVGGRVFGVVLNDIDYSKRYGGYYYYYRQYYRYYHEGHEGHEGEAQSQGQAT